MSVNDLIFSFNSFLPLPSDIPNGHAAIDQTCSAFPSPRSGSWITTAGIGPADEESEAAECCTLESAPTPELYYEARDECK